MTTLAERLFVVTGANTGIGRSTAAQLAAQGASVLLACRSEEKTRPVLEQIRALGAGEALFVPLDLSSLASVRAAAARINALADQRGQAVHCLINNAGQAAHRGLTEDGFELAFGVNHLGHFLLTMLLLPALRRATLPRVVNVASQAHYSAPGIDFDAVQRPTRSVTGLKEYAVSKLANVLFTKEFARRPACEGIHAYALHPGVVASDAWRRIPWPIRPLVKLRMMSNEDGAKTTLYCATSPETQSHTGLYYDACRVREPSAVSGDPELARRLWERSAEFTGLAGA